MENNGIEENINNIYNIDNNIKKSLIKIENKNNENGWLSQNILSQLRNLVDQIGVAICWSKKYISNSFCLDSYDTINFCKKELSKYYQYNSLNKFYKILQATSSHYTSDEPNSEHALCYFYEYLVEIRMLTKKYLGIDILENIENIFKLATTNESSEENKFYSEIAEIFSNNNLDINESDLIVDKFYVIKQKLVYLKNRFFYEVSLSLANDLENKSSRIVMFSKERIKSKYSVNIKYFLKHIKVFDDFFKVNIIFDWEHSIRDCEMKKLIYISTGKLPSTTKNKEYDLIMKYMKENDIDLLGLIEYDIICQIKNQLLKNDVTHIIDALCIFQNIIKNSKKGCNLLSYILTKMNNTILKNIISNEQNEKISNLYVKYECIPFDELPLCSDLPSHIPAYFDLVDSIDFENKDGELLYRNVLKTCEKKSIFFVEIPEEDMTEKNLELIKDINKKFYYKHREHRKLCIYKDKYYFINGMLINFISLKNKLDNDFVKKISVGLNEKIVDFIFKNKNIINSPEKEEKLREVFKNTSLLVIKGSAGTGKTYIVEIISKIFSNYIKFFLTNTHSAKENLRKRTMPENYSNFMTVKRFLNLKNLNEIDILFIDECSNISNDDFKQILEKIEKVNCKVLVLAGDPYQIESIKFGNWFNLLDFFIDKKCIIELTDNWRTNENKLKNVWKYVREFNQDGAVSEITRNNMSSNIGKDLLIKGKYDDEICLCLNYDGIYGINNINKLMQIKNNEKSFYHNNYEFKKNDPILFLESERYKDVLNNNLKGKILDIQQENDKTIFLLEIDKLLDDIETKEVDFVIKGFSEDNSKTIISLTVFKNRNYDEDDYYDYSNILPFQLSYAISIHKAQGLEYDSVKIVVSEDTDEKISHNIFYTAITRCKKNLKIFWSGKSLNKVLKNFSKNFKDFKKDVDLIKKFETENKFNI